MMPDDAEPDGHLAQRLETMLSGIGLMVRGATVLDNDGPELPDGTRAGSLVLIGHAGSSFWPHFDRFRAEYSGSDPLDHWTRRVILPIADSCQAMALFPFDRPWWPFQRWAARCEGLKPSPLGILIHPDYGLWHGYRAALAFPQQVALYPSRTLQHPCSQCSDRPCTTTCPVGAISGGAFDVGGCRGHLAGPDGGDCMDGGCLARNACPVGTSYRYHAAHRRFLMQALDLSL